MICLLTIFKPWSLHAQDEVLKLSSHIFKVEIKTRKSDSRKSNTELSQYLLIQSAAIALATSLTNAARSNKACATARSKLSLPQMRLNWE